MAPPYFGWDRYRGQRGSDLLTCRLRQPSSSRRRPAKRTASMAAKYFYMQGFLLLLFNFISTAALEKRFSDFKRCADEECSSKFASLLLKQIGMISRKHLCTIPVLTLP